MYDSVHKQAQKFSWCKITHGALADESLICFRNRKVKYMPGIPEQTIDGYSLFQIAL
jgi:hypothetical protein